MPSSKRTLASHVRWARWQLQPTPGIIQFCALALLTIVATPLCVLSNSAAEPQSREKKVLVLFSAVQYSQSFLQLIEPPMRARVPGPITFYDAYLEDPQVEEKSYRESVSETLRRRYAQVNLDLVIVCNPAALHFAVEYRGKIFPGVPIVFAGVGAGDLEKQKMWPGVTGVASPWGFRETIELMLRLHPDTNKVAVVAGESHWDNQFLAVAHSELLRHQDKVGEIDLVGPPNHQLFERVVALPPHTVVLFQAYPQYASQPEFGTWDLAAAVAQHLPTYSAFIRLCIDGCIGGAYEDTTKEALLTAEIAARVLLGERPDKIPVAYDTDLQIRVDWRALRRWQIPESALPPGTLVLYREPTLWERGRRYFIAGIAAILAQTFLILALFWQRAKKRTAEAELRRSEDKFSKSFRQSPLVVTITRMSDSRYIDVNETFEQHLGWNHNEVIGRTPHDFDLWVDVDKRTAFAKELLTKGSVRDLEVCLRKKDGETRTLLLSAELIDVGGEPCALSVAADITERKQAEEVLSTVSRRLIEAQEKERTRIARELHDDINQRVALVSVALESLKLALPSSEVQARCRLEETKQQVEDLGNDVQALSHRLHSSKLDYLGLAAACRGFCNELSERQSVEIEFVSDNVPKNLSKEISLCLFRVLQEALQNAVKYSGVRQFRVSLKAARNDIELSVHDSGVGFDLEKAIGGHGLGLTSMNERMKLVDGLLSIDSKREHGTTIHAHVPLSPKTLRALEGR